MKTFLLTILIYFTASLPQDHFKLVHTIAKKPTFFTTDNLRNTYIVQKEQLFKYNAQGNLNVQFSNLSLGDITYIDATNPMKLLVFYRDFSKILFLDNMLAEKAVPISLQEMGLDQTTLACTSFDNGFWVYDQANNKLNRFDQNLRKVQETDNINQLLGYFPQPNYMREHNDWLYLNDPDNGILVFDIFGTYFKTIPVKNLRSFQLTGNSLIYLKDGQLVSYHLQKLNETKMNLPVSHPKKVNVQKDRMMIHADDTVLVYEVK